MAKHRTDLQARPLQIRKSDYRYPNSTSIANAIDEAAREGNLQGLRTRQSPLFRHRTGLSMDSQSHRILHLD